MANKENMDPALANKEHKEIRTQPWQRRKTRKIKKIKIQPWETMIKIKPKKGSSLGKEGESGSSLGKQGK